MNNSKATKGEKLSYVLMKDVLIKICQKRLKEKKQKNNTSKNNDKEDNKTKILVTCNEVRAMLKIEKNIEVSHQCIRNWGFSDRGYFTTLYHNCIGYNNRGDTSERGMVIYVEKFLEEMEEEGRV